MKPQSPNKPLNTTSRNRKIARMWCLARELSFDSETLHLVVESVTGKESIAELNPLETDMVIRQLTSELKKQRNRARIDRTRNSQGGVSYLPSSKQKKFVDDLLQKITVKHGIDNPEKYLEYICQKTFNKPYKLMQSREVSRLIEALKSIERRS